MCVCYRRVTCVRVHVRAVREPPPGIHARHSGSEHADGQPTVAHFYFARQETSPKPCISLEENWGRWPPAPPFPQEQLAGSVPLRHGAAPSAPLRPTLPLPSLRLPTWLPGPLSLPPEAHGFLAKPGRGQRKGPQRAHSPGKQPRPLSDGGHVCPTPRAPQPRAHAALRPHIHTEVCGEAVVPRREAAHDLQPSLRCHLRDGASGCANSPLPTVPEPPGQDSGSEATEPDTGPSSVPGPEAPVLTSRTSQSLMRTALRRQVALQCCWDR